MYLHTSYLFPTNDFARSLGIPKDPIRAAKRIIKYKPEPIDIGSFNGDYFVYVAAFGAFTEVTYTTPQEYKNYLGHMAYILEGSCCWDSEIPQLSGNW